MATKKEQKPQKPAANKLVKEPKKAEKTEPKPEQKLGQDPWKISAGILLLFILTWAGMAATLYYVDKRLEEASSHDLKVSALIEEVDDYRDQVMDEITSAKNETIQSYGKLQRAMKIDMKALVESSGVMDIAEELRNKARQLESSLLDAKDDTLKPTVEALSKDMMQLREILSRKNEEEASSVKPLQLALLNLRSRITAGMPIQADLKVVQELLPDNNAMQEEFYTLKDQLNQGYTTLAKLREQFKHLQPALRNAARPNNASYRDYISGVVDNIVKIRKIGETPKPGTLNAVIADIEAALEHGKLEKIIENLKELSPAQEEVLSEWRTQLEHYIKIETLFAALQAHAVTKPDNPSSDEMQIPVGTELL